MNRIAAVVAGLSLAFVGTSTTFAATINVPADQPTIAAAISASVNGDVINIAAGTYNETNLNTVGKAITIQGTLNGDGSLATTIDAQGGGRVFLMSSWEGDDTVIKDLVITGGSSPYGGGIFCANSYPTIINCTIQYNTADLYGGGIYCMDNSSPTIINCTIRDNTAFYYGGGIYSQSSNPTITGCTILGNTAFNRGGGIFSAGTGNTVIENCTISGNQPNNCQSTEQASLTILTSAPASPSGACCLNGICITATETECTAAGGTYAGDDVACGDAGCATPPVTGACCVSSGCVANTSDDCTALGGTWLGEDASCDDCAPTCQGDANADGVVDVFDLLKVIDGWGTCP
jgi:parallel beta-helix repeat protein